MKFPNKDGKMFVKKGEVINGIPDCEWCECGHQQAIHEEPYGCQIHNFTIPPDRCDCKSFDPQHAETSGEEA